MMMAWHLSAPSRSAFVHRLRQSPISLPCPSLQKRPRHSATVFTSIPHSAAIPKLVAPAAAARTIRQRNATCCGVPCAATQRNDCSRSASPRLTIGLILDMPQHKGYWTITPAIYYITNQNVYFISTSFSLIRVKISSTAKFGRRLSPQPLGKLRRGLFF